MKNNIEKDILIDRARELRNNSTKEERKLWYEFLRDLKVGIKRQKVIGNYIVDFYCASSRTAIELDGSQHFEDKGIEYDKKRTEYLMSQGIRVLRYSNLEVNQNFEEVCQDIIYKLGLEV